MKEKNALDSPLIFLEESALTGMTMGVDSLARVCAYLDKSCKYTIIEYGYSYH